MKYILLALSAIVLAQSSFAITLNCQARTRPTDNFPDGIVIGFVINEGEANFSEPAGWYGATHFSVSTLAYLSTGQEQRIFLNAKAENGSHRSSLLELEYNYRSKVGLMRVGDLLTENGYTLIGKNLEYSLKCD